MSEISSIIKSFNIDTQNINFNGEIKPFSIYGDTGSIFSLEIYDNHATPFWYDWETETWGATRKRLVNKVIKNKVFNGNIKWPISSRGIMTHSFILTAETTSCTKTKFIDYTEVLHEDGTVDKNASSGSSTNQWTKEIIHGLVSDIVISSISPTLADSGEVWNGATLSSFTLSADAGSSGNNDFKITVTAPSGKAIRIDRQPLASDICTFKNVVIGASADPPAKDINDEDIWSETARSTNNVSGSGGGTVTNVDMAVDIGSPVKWAIGDRVTGNAALNAKTGDDAVYVTAVNVGSNASLLTISETMTIAHGTALTFTEPHYYRWPATNVVGLTKNILVDPNSAFANIDSRIDVYETYDDHYFEHQNGCELIVGTNSILKNSFLPIETTSPASASAYGKITTQAGNIIFNSKQGKSFESATVRFFGYGTDQIKALTSGTEIVFSDLVAEVLEANIVKTTVNDVDCDGETSLTVFDVASSAGIIDDVSVMRGVNVIAEDADPLVTNISSNTITIASAQVLQNGQSLTFDGGSSIVTITGKMEVKNVGNSATAINFDLDKFLTSA